MSIFKKRRPAMAGAASFAHLMGFNAEVPDDEDDKKPEAQDEKELRWAKLAESDPDRKQGDDESDDDYAARMEEMDDEEARAETEEQQDEKDEKDDKAKAARGREKARCAAIMAEGMKMGMPTQAGVFAFDTNMSVKAAIAAMKATKADSKGSLGQRMSAVTDHHLGAGPAASSAKNPAQKATAQAQQIMDAAKRARGG